MTIRDSIPGLQTDSDRKSWTGRYAIFKSRRDQDRRCPASRPTSVNPALVRRSYISGAHTTRSHGKCRGGSLGSAYCLTTRHNQYMVFDHILYGSFDTLIGCDAE